MDEIYFRKILTTIILVVLLVLTFFLLKPILLSMIFGVMLAFIFAPIYKLIYKYTQSGNISATLCSILLITVIILPLAFLIPVLVKQILEFYFIIQGVDLMAVFQSKFPSLFVSEGSSLIVNSLIDSFFSRIINALSSILSIDNIMNLFLKSFVVFFSFFFALRDKDKLMIYLQSLLPFSKDIEKKLIDSSKVITSAVLYGQVVIGIAQGLLVGLGFFVLKVPGALLLTALACLAGIFPIIGTAIVWIPVAIYLIIVGNTFSAIGITIFGVVSSLLDNFLRPIIVSRRTRINSLLILIGMIGGIYLFGFLGFILGPLVIAYLFIILEIYRNKESSGFLYTDKKGGLNKYTEHFFNILKS
ncbi:MAG: AI-2E family transporter [archaeon]